MKKNTFRKIFLVVPALIVAILASILFLNFQGGVHADVMLTPRSTYFAGSGTKESPYLISSGEALQELAKEVSKGSTFSGNYFRMTSDIDMKGLDMEPIGSLNNPFKGSFDGAGYVISNVTLTSTNSLKIGLFGRVVGDSTNTVIQNVGIKNININAQDLSSEFESEVSCGGLVGQAENYIIENCFVTNDEEQLGIAVSSYLYTQVGGIAGKLSATQVQNCYSDIKLTVASKTTSPTSISLGGIVGSMNETQLINTYSVATLSSSNAVAQNLDLIHYVGGLVGDVKGAYTSIINSFFVGKIDLVNKTDSGSYVAGLIVGSITANASVAPIAGNINYCHALKNSETNHGYQMIGANGAYSTLNIVLKEQTEDIFFKQTNQYSNEELYNSDYLFDFENDWLMESGYPVLQLFAYYEIEIEQVENCTLEMLGGEEVSENVKRYKAGTKVQIVASINPEVQKFYTIRSWKRNQTVIENTEDVGVYEFECQYSTQGKYTVNLEPNTFNVKVEIPEEFRNIASVKYFTSSSIGYTWERKFAYLTAVSFETVLNSSEEAQNYAFDGWYAGIDGATRIESDSKVLSFNVGEELVPFDDQLNIYLTPKFTRDICRFTLNFDSNMGEIKFEEKEQTTTQSYENEARKKGSTTKIEALPKEGYKFEGWFLNDEAEEAISTDLELDYSFSEDTQQLQARFSPIDEEAGKEKGLSGWAIFGIVAGCLAVVGIVVLIIVLVKKKGSYKSGWNF